MDQFKSVFTRDTSSTLPHMEKKFKHVLPPLNITTNGVEKLLLRINVTKASGPDKIPNLILKNCACQLAPGLCEIFQHSVDSGELPSNWLNANIAPVFKKGDVHASENYRPVS